MAALDPRQREDRPPKLRLVTAVRDGRLESITSLLRGGALTEQVDEMGLTPLLAATRAGNTAAIEVLLDAGAHINSYGQTRWTALHFAAHLGDLATIETLVRRGGDLGARTAVKGKSPLHIAAGHAEARAVQDLVLRWGADETQLDCRGCSASDVAGALKNVFERDCRHAERVERIRAQLANAPRDRRWIRRRAVVMLVSRLREEIARERSSRAESSSAAKKRSGGAAAAEPSAEPATQVGHSAAPTVAAAAAAAATSEEGEEEVALWYAVRRSGGAGGFVDGASEERQASLPHGMEAFRDAVIRLGGEDDVGIFRSVVGFL